MGYYFFIINDSGGNGMSREKSGFWRIKIGGRIRDSGSSFRYHDGFYGFGKWPTCSNSKKKMAALLLKTDAMGNETGWSLSDAHNGQILFANTVTFRNNTLYTQFRCVPNDSTLVFRITDSGGNGLCCGFGQGFFAMYYQEKKMIKGERFAGTRSVKFLT